MLTPVDRGVIYLGKFLGNVLFMLVTEAIILPIFAALFDAPVANPLLWLIMLLGTIGLAAVGTLFAAMAVSTRAREIMLPLLLFPVSVPVLIAATKATAQVMDGAGPTAAAPWLRLLLAFDLIFTTVAFLGFEYVLEE
jgi:heme exporter protein B